MTIVATSGMAKNLGGKMLDETFRDPLVAELVKAAVSGQSERVAKLKTQGVDVNSVGDGGVTPLIWTLNARSHAGVAALLKAGADPNLLPKELGNSAMYFSSMGDDPKLLTLLLQGGGNPNHLESGKIGERPLSVAAHFGRLENIRLLLDSGADINAHDKYGNSAALEALALGRFDAIALLLERGYNFDLSALAGSVKRRGVQHSSDAQRWKETVVSMLAKRGV